MAFKEKDFLLVEYTARVKETGEIIDTTSADVAKEAKIYSEGEVYEPMLVILGEHRVIKGLEEELYKMEPGVEKEVEIPPEKAYGRRDPSKVKIMSVREFRRANIEPRPGKIVEVNGLPAVIKSVSGGRVVVDFNHPLAGKTLIYKVKVVGVVEDDAEKIKHLLHRRMKQIPLDEFDVEIDRETGKVTIRLPERAYLLEDVQYAKRAVAFEIFKYIPDVAEVVFIERYVNPNPPKKEEKTVVAEEAEKTGEEKKSETGKKAAKKKTSKGKARKTKKTAKGEATKEESSQQS
jgi:peptidylprolyl isomerase